MGVLWIAEDTTLGVNVVVKFLKQELAQHPRAARRIAKEAAAAARVRSPHVVQVLDHGISDGIPFLVMELLEGRDLRAWLRDSAPLSEGDTVSIIQQLAEALSKAHAQGIVHLDVKPSNIFLLAGSGLPFIKLLDFGLARGARLSDRSSTTTRRGAGVGTPPYMSPEQLVGGELDFRSDVWSLGVVAYECLTGHRPFSGETLGATALAIHTDTLPRPCAANPRLPTTIDAWFARACARSQSERFQSALEAAEALACAFSAHPVGEEPLVARPTSHTLTDADAHPRLSARWRAETHIRKDDTKVYGAPMSTEQAILAGLQPGDVLAGKYRVERVLGAGGMGVVVAAHHIQLDEKVALKFLLPESLEDTEAVSRFMAEARRAVKIKSEHVARVTDVGQLESGAPYMVMEYLLGEDLDEWLERGPLPVEQAVDFILQASEAVAEAHSLGIVHRDLKPANLFCIQRPDGRPAIKVLDFGISKVTTPGAEGHDMTRTNSVVGSPFYMSPEHLMASKSVDARTDIWALGVILFELVTGCRPFEAEALTELAVKVATQAAPPLRSFSPDVPAGLEQVVAKCLEKDRTARYQSVGELAVALQEFAPAAARLSVERIVGTLQKAGVSVNPTVTMPPLTAPSSPELRSRAANTTATWDQSASGGTLAGVKLGQKTILGFAILAGVAVSTVGGVLAFRGHATSNASLTEAVANTSASTSVTASSSKGGGETIDTPASGPAVNLPGPTVSSPSFTVPAPSASSATKPQGGGAKAPSGAQARTPAPALSAGSTAKPPAANCNPPYVIDSNGDRQYKPECLRH
jgi:serine/threonine-protein kinase